MSSVNSVNRVILVGNLGKDPELRSTPSGRSVCSMSLATNASWVDKEGTKHDKTNWHRVVVWGKTGEVCKQHLSKGRQICVEGRLENSSYTDKTGVKRYSTDIVSDAVVFLGGGHRPGAGREAGVATEEPVAAMDADAVDDIPF
jgi:single-strand DNA-binding protein